MNQLTQSAKAAALEKGIEFCGGVSLRGQKLLPQGQRKLPPDPAGVLVFLFPYYTGEMEGRNISRYAAVPDYHIIVMDILRYISDRLSKEYADNIFVPLVDSSPINEVAAAAACGLGLVGRHGMLINQKYGSYVFIGEIVTDAQLPPALTAEGCTGCHRCQVCCPGGAIGENFEKDSCLSHITQIKGKLTDSQQKAIAQQGFVWGCDVCLDICPLNKRVLTPIREFYSDIIPNLTPETIPQLMKHACGWRGQGVLERNLEYISRK